MPCPGSMPDATQPGNRWRPGLRHLAAPVLSAQDELQRDYETALAEIAALMAERARLSARLAHADAEVSVLRAARDAALRLTVWGSPLAAAHYGALRHARPVTLLLLVDDDVVDLLSLGVLAGDCRRARLPVF
jgi:hypothetical protein